MNKKKQYEKKIIKEFLLFKGCNILARIELGENPDAKVLIKDSGHNNKIAIEHTDYCVDASHGIKSTGKEIYTFWREVRISINKRVSKRPNLWYMTGMVKLDGNRLRALMVSTPKNKRREHAKKLAQSLAAEFIRLSLKYYHVVSNGMQDQDIKKFSKEEFPFLNKYVNRVTLRDTGSARISWECTDTNVSSIGVSEKEIALIIKNKTKDFPKYHWNDVDERWLLITASGATVFDSAGPNPDHVNWTSAELRDACNFAAIERIIFWDRMYNWYKEIWPGEPLVKREWRAKIS